MFASKELCEKLYKLTNWLPSEYLIGGWRWCKMYDGSWELLRLHDTEGIQGLTDDYAAFIEKSWFDGLPAYNLGFLIRELRQANELVLKSWGDEWLAIILIRTKENDRISRKADTPENAAVELCIALVEQEIIKP